MVSQGHLRQLATGLRAELQQLESLQLIDPRGLRHLAQWTQPLLILAKSLAFGVARSSAFGKLLIQPGRLATPRAFAPRLVVRTRDGVAGAGDFCTQRLADMLRLGSFARLPTRTPRFLAVMPQV